MSSIPTAAQQAQGAPVANAGIALTGADITTSDVTDYARAFRGVYVGNGGDVKIRDAGGNDLTFKNVPAGYILPIVVVRVWTTGTTSTTGLIGLY